jgi:hypothetical protein
MQSTIDKNLIKEAVENSVDAFVHQQLDSVKHDFDKLFAYDSLSAEAIDDLRRIQCLIDEARSAEENIKILDNKIDIVLNKSREIIAANQSFLQKYNGKDVLPLGQVISDLSQILNSCKEKLDSFSKRLQYVKDLITPISRLSDLKKDSSRREFEEWAESFEMFTDAFEEGIEFFNNISFDAIKSFSKEILSLASEKSYENRRKDRYKRRLKFSANYIIKIIDEKKIQNDPKQKETEYTIVRDLRTLAHAQYKIAISQIMSEMKVNGMEHLKTEDDIAEVAVNLIEDVHGERNKVMP